MAPAHSDVIRLGEGERRGLDVAAVKRDLAALWKEEGEARGGESTVLRVCHSTLIMPLAPGEEEHGLLDDVVRLHPSRVIVVHAEPGLGTGGAEAWVSAACSRGPGGRSLVCCETVHLACGPGADRNVASAVRSLSVGGVPAVVVAEAVSPLEIPWVQALEEHLDLVIGNGGCLGVEQGLALWRRCRDRAGAVPGYRDALWSGLVDWRRALALPFDRRGAAAELSGIRRLSVEASEGPGALLEAWLLIGWLAGRLGWRLREASAPDRALVFAGPEAPVEVALARAGKGGDSAPVCGVEMEFAAGRPSLRWRRLSPERAILVERNGERLARLNQAKTGRASAVVDEIHRPEADPMAMEAMEAALEFAAGNPAGR